MSTTVNVNVQTGIFLPSLSSLAFCIFKSLVYFTTVSSNISDFQTYNIIKIQCTSQSCFLFSSSHWSHFHFLKNEIETEQFTRISLLPKYIQRLNFYISNNFYFEKFWKTNLFRGGDVKICTSGMRQNSDVLTMEASSLLSAKFPFEKTTKIRQK